MLMDPIFLTVLQQESERVVGTQHGDDKNPLFPKMQTMLQKIIPRKEIPPKTPGPVIKVINYPLL